MGKAYDKKLQGILTVLQEYEHMWGRRLEETRIAKHCIDITTAEVRPVHSAPCCAELKASEFEKKEIDKMLRMIVIEPARLELALPIVFAVEKNGSLRFSDYYRKRNTMTAKHIYHIPRIGECIQSLQEARFLSTLNTNSGDWQTAMGEEKHDKTKFFVT